MKYESNIWWRLTTAVERDEYSHYVVRTKSGDTLHALSFAEEEPGYVAAQITARSHGRGAPARCNRTAVLLAVDAIESIAAIPLR